MEIKSITIVNTGGADIIYLETDLPNPIWPFTNTAILKLESATSKTGEWISTNFPNIPVKKLKLVLLPSISISELLGHSFLFITEKRSHEEKRSATHKGRD